MKKRGTSQIDWVVSLALFLIYLGWFFVIIRPTLAPINTEEDIFGVIRTNFEREAKTNVNLTPIIIISNYTHDNFPLYADIPESMQKKEFSFQDKRPYAIADGKLFFFEDIKRSKDLAYIAQSEEEYEKPSYSTHMTLGADYISTQSIRADFDKSNIKTIYYGGEPRIDQFKIERWGQEITSKNISFFSSDIMARSRSGTDYMDFSTYIFDDNSMIMTIAEPYTSTAPFNLTYSMKVYGYTTYYGTNNDFGTLNYTEPDCSKFDSDKIIFNDAKGSLTFLLGNTSEISICYQLENETGVTDLKITMPFSNTMKSRILFSSDKGNISLTINDLPKAEIGMSKEIKGYTLKRISDFEKKNYATAKIKWNVPAGKDFSIALKDRNDTLLMDYSKASIAEGINVYTNEYSCVLVDKLGYITQCTVIMKNW